MLDHVCAIPHRSSRVTSFCRFVGAMSGGGRWPRIGPDCSINSLVPTGVQVDTFRTVMQLTFTTFCGSVLLTTQCKYINLLPNIILRVILNGCFGALPNMRGNMFPWSIRRVTDLPPDAKLG